MRFVLRALLLLVACSAPKSTPATPVAPEAPAPVEVQPAPKEPLPAAPIASDAVKLRIGPTPAYIERAEHGQLVNCDLLVENTAPVALALEKLQVTALDRAGQLITRKFLDGNGVSPSITTIPNREVLPGKQALVMNPLYQFPRDAELAKLRFELTYAVPFSTQKVVAIAEVAPTAYANRSQLAFPLRGRVIVWDGHDFLAHHRRWDYLFEVIRNFGFTSNAGRYSYDFVHVDAAGAMHTGDDEKNEAWFSFGKPVVSPAAGTVVAVVDDQLDNREFDMAAIPKNRMVIYGNHVVIDHGGGEFSLFAHLQQKSAKVKVGDRVKRGTPVAAIGASGSANFPHLHYQLQTGPDANAEGLPSYFTDVVRIRGSKRIATPLGQVDSGDLVESTTR